MKLDLGQKVGPEGRWGVSVDTIHLRTDSASLIIGTNPFGLPEALHWGSPVADEDIDGFRETAAPAIVNSSLDVPRRVSLLASRAQGWSGTPTVELTAADVPIEQYRLGGIVIDDDRRGARITVGDREGQVELTYTFRFTAGSVLEMQVVVTNVASDRELTVGAVRAMLPLPARARESLDFTGRWTGERRPQRALLRDGSWIRRSRRGRPGHDASFLTIVGTQNFTFRSGEVWGLHLGWSGDQEVLVERLPEGAGVHSSVFAASELIDQPGVVIGPGEHYATPVAHFAWSREGIDGLTAAFHESARARPSHPRTPRPLVLNTWEAVYFDHDATRLTELADRAAAVGVERFVLDDGWFRGRRDDTAGLGDWFVDTERWPNGLLPLSRHVHELGMEFGLWFEPEMVNRDSDLARDSPDWVLGEADELSWRHQFALDFSRSDVRNYITDRIDIVVREAEVDFIKWDHNRDLHASLSSDGHRRVREHTLGVYAVMDEIRRRHPALEIESCASGGARVDWGVLARTDRVWASDSNDPFERQSIQRWTQTLVPPELIGSHIGPENSHTTHRHTTFSFRAITALFAHAGIEWDLSSCTAAQLAEISCWASLYRELRPLLHDGVTVRADHVDDGAVLHGVVSRQRDEAVFAWIRLETSATAHTPRVPFPGLDLRSTYEVRVRDEVGEASRHQIHDPSWLLNRESPRRFSGALLAEGLPLPLLNPGQGMLFHLLAV